MSDNVDQLYKIRHSLAHVLAQAVLDLWPDAKVSIGPPVDTGCYYDFKFKEPISADDFKTVEQKMRKIINQGQTFAVETLKISDAIKYWKGKDQQFKVELIEDLAKAGETEVTHYKNIDSAGTEKFVDLCKGGHVENVNEIPADGFKIMSLAGAYWRGDETRDQLTRIYVVAFESKDDLKAHLTMLEEAKKRDHRKLGKELSLFAFSEKVGPGLPLWLPNGTVLCDELEKLAKQTEDEFGYKQVRTPHIAKGALYQETGHLAHYQESMFPPMQLDGEKEEYYLKPMNCPHHHQIFASESHSYKDLPLRLAEYGHCYRYEDSGALFGLMRVRSLCMNDAHIYCTEEQFMGEFQAVTRMYLRYFEIFGVEKYNMRLSLHEPSKLGEKYVDAPELWKKTEDMVRKAMKESGVAFTEVADEAAFYGPKIDIEVWSAIGREFTLATNQIDFDVPGKVGLTYTAPDGSNQTPLCIHRAPLGTHERFIGFLIEHFAGAFPVWLAPVQVAVLPVAEVHEAYANEVVAALKEQGIRVELYESSDSLGKRVRNGQQQKVPYLLVLGDTEVQDKSVTVRALHSEEQNTISLFEFVKSTVQKVANRELEY